MRQSFNAREGVTPDQIDLPKRITAESLPIQSGAPPQIDFQALKEGFFRTMGWDIKTGVPSGDTLAELGLSELTGDLIP